MTTIADARTQLADWLTKCDEQCGEIADPEHARTQLDHPHEIVMMKRVRDALAEPNARASKELFEQTRGSIERAGLKTKEERAAHSKSQRVALGLDPS